MKDVDITNCRYSADIVPYMYGELAAAETSSFESHLLECTSCTDEFAATSAARYEVYDWKKLEFDPLPTPVIRVPFAEVATSGWVEKIRGVFSHSWASPGFAFAGIVLVAAIAAVFLLNTEKASPDIVADTSSDAVIEVPTSPPSSVGNAETGTIAVTPPAGGRPVSAPNRRRAIRESRRSAQRPVEARMPATASQNRAVPRLNEFTEEEDNSLRLAELFEDVETSD